MQQTNHGRIEHIVFLSRSLAFGHRVTTQTMFDIRNETLTDIFQASKQAIEQAADEKFKNSISGEGSLKAKHDIHRA